MKQEVELQREYYTRTASYYDELHADETPALALGLLDAVVGAHGIRSVLDVGSGTGRVVEHLHRKHPGLKVVGVEPVEALRTVGHQRGLAPDMLVDGDATKLGYPDDSFDLVCAFSTLHHIPVPSEAVGEMLRVASRGIFILDANNLGQGRPLARFAKRWIYRLGLWPIAEWIKTRGKGYRDTPGDGIAYTYSVFQSYKQIRARSKSMHMLGVSDSNGDLFRTCPVVALLALKR